MAAIRAWFVGLGVAIAARLSLPPGIFGAALWNAIIAAIVNTIVSYMAAIVIAIVKWLLKDRDCDWRMMILPILGRGLLSFVEHWFDVGLDDLITNVSYSINRACPTHLPTQPSIDQCYLAGIIDKETWKCWTRAQNNLDVPHYAAVHAQRQQPNANQWISAWQRGIITEQDLSVKLRNSGVLIDSEADIFKRLMEQLPGPGDIIRFMLRDVEDPAVVNKYQLDDEFLNKFQGRSREWARGQGLTEDLMRRYWRAHWDWPSPTQLYEMLHRLREDSINPDDRKLKVTLDDVKQVLGINDVIPIWRERLARISYRLPRLVDAYKFFYLDQWSEVELLDYYQNYGYIKSEAEKIVKISKRRKYLEKRSKAGLLTKSKITTAYVNGTIGKQEAIKGYRELELDDEQLNWTIEQADYLRVIALRKQLMKSIKCRFSACEYSPDQAVSALVNGGWDVSDAVYTVSCWKQQCTAKGKEATTAQLCEWYGLGLLSDFEYRKRLRRLGWSQEDSDRIIGQCVDKIRKRKEKESKKGSVSSGSSAE